MSDAPPPGSLAMPSGFQNSDLGQLTAAWPAQYARQQAPLLPSKFVTFKVGTRPGVIGWRATYEDFRPGGNRQVGTFERAGSRFASSKGLDSRYQEQLVLAQLTTAAATPVPAGTAEGLLACNIFNTLVMASYLGALGGNPSLFKETSATDPTVVSLNYANQISSISPILIGGYGNSLRLVVGNGGGPPDLLSDVAATPTVVGAMHANLSGLWGLIQTPQNSDAILFYTNTGIQSLLATDAYNALPTLRTPGVPTGGYALGMLALAGAAPRAWWVWPKAQGVQSTLYLNFETPSRVMSTDVDGYLPTELKMDLKYTILAAIFRDGIVASDLERIVWTNGRSKRDLKIFIDRPVDSNFMYRVRKLTVNGPELIADVDLTIASGGAGNTVSWRESYDFDLDTWAPISEQTTYGTTGQLTLASGGLEGGPLSQKTGFMHSYANGNWYRQFIPPYGTSPFSLRQSAGAPLGTGREFAASGVLTGAACWPPAPCAGLPLSVTKVTCKGDLYAGGAVGGGPEGEALAVAVGGITAKFFPRSDGYPQVWEPEDGAVEPFYQLQPVFTAYRGTTTQQTPQILPVEVEGYAFTDGTPAPNYIVRPET